MAAPVGGNSTVLVRSKRVSVGVDCGSRGRRLRSGSMMAVSVDDGGECRSNWDDDDFQSVLSKYNKYWMRSGFKLGTRLKSPSLSFKLGDFRRLRI